MRLLNALAASAALTLVLAGPMVAAPALAAAPARVVVSQLPLNAKPLHYTLHVTPDAQAMTFDAQVLIDVEVLETTSSLTLHSLDLTYTRASIDKIGKAVVTTDPKSQTATFTFDRPLKPGKYRLGADYRGKIYTQAAGLFALDYQTETGPKRALFTQFEAPDARRFLPSWDEPNFKARFDLTATVPSGQMAVSNMPVAAQVDAGNGLKTVRFATSPKMSTYLLSFNLGEFERRTSMVGKTEIGVVTKAGDLDKGDFAMTSAREVTAWFNDYFGTPYALPKMDHIAAPGQSQFFSAMENWGSIFYFEYALLLDPSFSTPRDKQRVFTTVAHETAHQWFGNLVTMAWWDDLWLNEGFASWMEGRATEKFHPEWNAGLEAIRGRESAMTQDALVTTHPVVQKVDTVEQAMQAFDGITYNKGEAVLRMMESYVGSDAWREGVRAYMKRHAYGNTLTTDLWGAVEKAAGKPIQAVARDFTLQPGIPLIRVDSAECRDGSTHLNLVQSEFAPDRPGKTSLIWRVPVSAKVAGSGSATNALIENGKGHMVLAGCGPVVVNAGQSGYYRTDYGPVASQLAKAYPALEDIDQLGILADRWALGLGGVTDPSQALDLISVLPVDADPQVWSQALGIIRSTDDLYDASPVEQARWRVLSQARLNALLSRVGWSPVTGELDTLGNLRNDLVSVMGTLGDAGVIAEARRRFAASATDPSQMPPALRRTITGVVARHADAATWEALRNQARSEKSPLIQQQLYAFLGSALDPALARKALDLALTSEPGETTSAGMMVRVSANHPDMAFDYAVANLEAVNAKLEASARSSFIPALGAGSSQTAMIGKIEAFANAHIPSDARRNAEESIGAIRERLRIREKTLPLITAWMNRQGS